MNMKNRSRQAVINHALGKELCSLYRIRRIGLFREEPYTVVSYAVTIKKLKPFSFEQRTEIFYRLLLSMLTKHEKLICEDRCFKIVGCSYILIYCFEGYRKNADRIGYISHGVAQSTMIHRMGCERAVREFNRLPSSILQEMEDRMSLSDLKRAYPNPADRFVAIIHAEKKLHTEERPSELSEHPTS